MSHEAPGQGMAVGDVSVADAVWKELWEEVGVCNVMVVDGETKNAQLTLQVLMRQTASFIIYNSLKYSVQISQARQPLADTSFPAQPPGQWCAVVHT